MSETSIEEMNRVLDLQKSEFQKNLPVDNAIRIDRMNRAVELLSDNVERIEAAITADWSRGSLVTYLVEVGDPIARIKYAIKNLSRWTRAEKRSPVFPFSLLGGRARVERVPVGVVGIMSPWNGPLMLCFGPLASVFAAGNSAMLKVSDMHPAVGDLMAELVGKYFEEHELAVVTGGLEASKAFSSLAFDHLVFTGSSAVAKNILHAAADNLTPVTLELGGKSPVIIAEDADIDLAALRIVTGKAMNGGQVCVSPDYVFVPENKEQQFIESASRVFGEQYPDFENNVDQTSIINRGHFDRLTEYLSDAGAKGASATSTMEITDAMREKLFFPLHFVVNPSDECRISQEEIFGPIIVVRTYADEEQTINYIQSRPRPLVLYYFGGDTAFRKSVLNRTMSGDVGINDVLSHAAHPSMPFGGVGNSGNGSCYAYEGFLRLTHAKSVYQQTPVDKVLAMLRPPFGGELPSIARDAVKK